MQMVEEWLKEGAERWEPKWFMRAESASLKFARWVGERPVTPALLSDWEEHLAALGQSDIKSLNIAAMAYRNAIRKGWAARNPFREYQQKPVARERRRKRSVINHDYGERIAKIAVSCRVTWYPLWVGCYETGMDRLDVTTLKWSHIDRATWTIKRTRHKMEKRAYGGEFVTAVDPAGRFYQSILWSLELLKRKGDSADEADREYVFPKLYKTWMRSAGVQSSQALREWMRDNHFPAFTFHDLRFARITAMVNSGVPYHVVRQVSGHASDSMLLHYIGTHADLTRESVLHSTRFSTLCPTQANVQLPSASDPTVNRTSFDSTLERASRSSRKQKSSSATTSPKPPTKLELWLKKRAERTSAVIAAVPIARATGKLSSQEQFGPDSVELPSPSNSPSDSSPSEGWLT